MKAIEILYCEADVNKGQAAIQVGCPPLTRVAVNAFAAHAL
jgi:hypothetical protein